MGQDSAINIQKQVMGDMEADEIEVVPPEEKSMGNCLRGFADKLKK